MPKRRRQTERQEPVKAAIEETKRQIALLYGSKFDDWDPLIEMSLMAADRSLPEMQRFAILSEIVEYWYPKQKAVEIDVNIGGQTGVLRVPTTPQDWTEAATEHRERILDGDYAVEG